MLILGIDPGIATTGFAILHMRGQSYETLDFGHISTSKDTPTPLRLSQIAEDLKSLCMKWKPQVCAVESIFFSKNKKTAIQVAQARGVILQTLSQSGYPVFEYNPLQIKVALTGSGKADKEQIQKMVRLILKLKTIPRPDDAADALAIALCHAHRARYSL